MEAGQPHLGSHRNWEESIGTGAPLELGLLVTLRAGESYAISFSKSKNPNSKLCLGNYEDTKVTLQKALQIRRFAPGERNAFVRIRGSACGRRKTYMLLKVAFKKYGKTQRGNPREPGPAEQYFFVSTSEPNMPEACFRKKGPRSMKNRCQNGNKILMLIGIDF